MAAANLTSIATTLKGVRDAHMFLKIAEKKDGVLSPTRIQITGHDSTWKKTPDFVYSPATGLAGTKADVKRFLNLRIERNDESAAQVLKEFEKDDVITHKNHTQQKYADKITDITRGHRAQAKSRETSVKKTPMIDREKIPAFFNRVREIRVASGNGSRSVKTDIIRQYLDQIKGTDKVFRIHGCGPDGKSKDQKLRTADRKKLSKESILLGDSGDLSYFAVPAEYDERRYVANFMALYYMHAENLKHTDAVTQAREFAETLLSPYKKIRGRRVSPASRSRSGSPKSRSGSGRSARSQSPRKARSVTTRKTVSPASRGSSPVRSPSRGRSASPAKTPKRTASTVQTAGSSRVGASPARSPSPVKTPRAAAAGAGQARRFRVPPRAVAK